MEQGAWKTVGEQMGDKGTARGRTSMQRANDMIDTLAAALPQAHAMFTARSQQTQHTAREQAAVKALRAAYFDGLTELEGPRNILESLVSALACQGPRNDRNGTEDWCEKAITKIGQHLANKGETWPAMRTPAGQTCYLFALGRCTADQGALPTSNPASPFLPRLHVWLLPPFRWGSHPVLLTSGMPEVHAPLVRHCDDQ